MKSIITVDARGAGQGKTTDPTSGIYSKIKQLRRFDEQVIIVAPSKDLQSQYHKDLEKESIEVAVVNSGTDLEAKSSIKKQLDQVLQKQTSVISITDQGFKHNVIDYNDKKHYHLILDECIKPISSHTIISKYFPLSTPRWNRVFTKTTEVIIPGYCELELTSAAKNDPIGQSIDYVNYRIFVKESEYDEFMKTYKFKDASMTYMAVLRPDRLEGWKSIHIAAAAFEYTLTCQWLKMFNIDYKIDREFIPHEMTPTKKLYIYFSEKNISKRQYVKGTKMVERLQSFAASIAKDGEYISLYNKDIIDEDEIDHIKNGHKIKHNAHGINHFQHINTCLVLSTLNYSKTMQDFIDMITPGVSKLATETYTHYQFIMRSSLRNNSDGDCHVIIPSGISAAKITNFFKNDENVVCVNIIDQVGNLTVKTKENIDIKTVLSELEDKFYNIPGYPQYQLSPALILRKWSGDTFVDTDKSHLLENNQTVNLGKTGQIRIKALIKLTFKENKNVNN